MIGEETTSITTILTKIEKSKEIGRSAPAKPTKAKAHESARKCTKRVARTLEQISWKGSWSQAETMEFASKSIRKVRLSQLLAIFGASKSYKFINQGHQKLAFCSGEKSAHESARNRHSWKTWNCSNSWKSSSCAVFSLLNLKKLEIIKTNANSTRKIYRRILAQKVVAGTLCAWAKKALSTRGEFPTANPGPCMPKTLEFLCLSFPRRWCQCQDVASALTEWPTLKGIWGYAVELWQQVVLVRRYHSWIPKLPMWVCVWSSWPQAGPILEAQKHFVFAPKLDRTLFGALSSNVVARKATCDLVMLRVIIVPYWCNEMVTPLETSIPPHSPYTVLRNTELISRVLFFRLCSSHRASSCLCWRETPFSPNRVQMEKTCGPPCVRFS